MRGSSRNLNSVLRPCADGEGPARTAVVLGFRRLRYWMEMPPLVVVKLMVGPPEPRLVSISWRWTPDWSAAGWLREMPPLVVSALRCAE